jgi:hypothetical protein
MQMTRRGMMRGLVGAACSVAAHPLVTPMALAAVPGENRLVVILLRGAMDGLDVVRPRFDPLWAQHRPALADGPAGLALCLGFGILSLSQLRQQAEFGLLAAGTILLAGIADLVFNPALTSRVRIVTLWDVLSLDLGENPHEAIPIFRGLSKWQARIVALMTEIVSLHKGQRLIQSGQKSDGMYVVIEGDLQSSVERDGVLVPLNRHIRGDVLGEVGLFRGERTANVDCESEVRALRFNQENLARLQRRYPRTASTLLRNLSEVLADRLAGATARVAR